MQGIIVGLGGRARSWIGVCQRNPDVTLVGYVDIVQGQRESIAQQFELPQEQMFASLDEAVKSVEADFALDVTPDNLKSLALVFASIQSAKEGRFVDIAEL